MSHLPWTDTVTCGYLICSVVRVIAYVPQIRALCERGGAGGVSVVSWVLFAIAHGATLLYAAVVRHDDVLAWMSLLNTAGSLAVAALALRRQTRDRIIYVPHARPLRDHWVTIRRRLGDKPAARSRIES